MKFHMALPVVYSCLMAACVGDFKLELCTYDFCASDEQKEKKEIKVAFENLSGNVSIDLSAGAKANETIVVDSKKSSGGMISFSGFLGDDEFVKVAITEEPDNQICKLKSGGEFKASDITEDYTLTVSCVDANVLPIVGYSVLGDLTLTIDGKEDFVVAKDSTNINVKTVDAYTHDSTFEVTAHPTGYHCKINKLSDFHKNADPGRAPVEVYCFAPSPVIDVVPTYYGWSILRADGLAASWGFPYFHDTTGIRDELLSIDKLQELDPVLDVAFPHSQGAIKKDGGIVGWGVQGDPDIPSFNEIQAVGVTTLYSHIYSLQVYTNAGEIISIGNTDSGGPVNIGPGINSVYQTDSGVAIHKTDGSLIILGDEANKAWNPAAFDDLSNVKKVIAVNNYMAGFILIKESGGVKHVVPLLEELSPDAETQARLAGGIKDAVYCNGSGNVISAITSAGDLVVWGVRTNHRTVPGSVETLFATQRELDGAAGFDSMADWANLQKDAEKITCNGSAFAVTKTDGSVVAFGETDASSAAEGYDNHGGADFYPVKGLLVNIKNVIPNGSSGFLAETHDNKFIYWGRTEFLDDDDNPVPPHGDNGPVARGEVPFLDGAKKIVFSKMGIYAALMPDRSVVAGGAFTSLGKEKIVKFSDVEADLHDIVGIYASGASFAALRSDGALVTWGSSDYGGDSSEFQVELNR